MHFCLFVNELEQNWHCVDLVAFFATKNAHVNVVIYNACLFVMPACLRCLKSLDIYPCFLFLVGLFVGFNWFLGSILIMLTFLVCCCRYSTAKVLSSTPFFYCFCLLLSWFWLGVIASGYCASCSVFVLFFPAFFLEHLCCLSSFLVFVTFEWPTVLFILLFFLFFLARAHPGP